MTGSLRDPPVASGPSPSRPSSLSAARRRRELRELGDGAAVDILVVGGGVTGCGVALDAATRGLSVALVERRDLANGTSRWSSKLVHGGLRYLSNLDLGIAYESAVERGVLMEHTAPHLTRALPILLPTGGVITPRRAAVVGAGLLAGNALRIAAGTSARTLPHPRRISAPEAGALFPAIARDGLTGGLLSFDGQLCDDARLVVTLARTAAAHGARILTRCEAREVATEGALVEDTVTDERLRVRARSVINATGVWADRLSSALELRPSKGVHVVLRSHRLGNPRSAIYAPVPGTENRYVVGLPQDDGRVYVGLTDTPARTVTDEPTADPSDTDFLLATINGVLERPLVGDDVVGTFAGLRPLVAGGADATADLSRHHQVLVDDDGVVTIVGGKLTTYRAMAEDAVDTAVDAAGLPGRQCVTTRTPLVGAVPRRRLPEVEAPRRLVHRYGSEATEISTLAADDGWMGAPVVEGLPYLRAELLWAVRHELALTVDDLLDRRTRIGLVPADREAAVHIAEEALAIGDDP